MIDVLILTCFVIVGAFLNRVRGGLRIPGTDKRFPICKLWQPIAYGLFLGLYVRVEGINQVWFGLMNGLTMYLGQQITGWGSYIGSLTGGAEPSPESPAIDELPIMQKSEPYPRLWGFIGLSCRGLIWTYLIGSIIYSPLLIASGVLMGTCYLIAELIMQGINKDVGKNSWNLGEWIFGGFLWLIIGLVLL